MMFLRASGSTRCLGNPVDTESRYVIGNGRSTRFPNWKLEAGCIRGNCHCRAFRLLVGVLAGKTTCVHLLQPMPCALCSPLSEGVHVIDQHE